jgi:hypothetical protein
MRRMPTEERQKQCCACRHVVAAKGANTVVRMIGKVVDEPEVRFVGME